MQLCRICAWGLSITALATLASAQGSSEAPKFKDDPKAHAAYDQMVKAMRKANSLSWQSEYSNTFGGQPSGKASYKVWLQKPNYARIEASDPNQKGARGILVLDGKNMWKWWPNGKLQYPFEMKGSRAEFFKAHSKTFYGHHPVSGVGRHSLGHEIGELGTAISMSILDASTFHGYTDSLQRFIDGVRFIEPKTVGGEKCKGIEISIMKGQRSWYIWLSPKDGLPRSIRQIVRVSKELIMDETWSNVAINKPIKKDLFAWKPPKGWVAWKMPEIEEGLLTAGTEAPDFELTSIDGTKIKLSDFKGNIVWLNFWRCG